jgi:bacillolysin
MNSMPQVRRVPGIIAAAVFALVLFPASGIDAGKKSSAASLGLAPLSRVSTAPSPASSGGSVNHHLIGSLEEALRAARSEPAPALKGPRRGNPPAVARAENSRAARLREELAGETRVNLRSSAGTPRQIRLSPEARRRGAVLEKAVAIFGSREERDRATARSFLRSRRGILAIADPDREMRFSGYGKDDLGRRHIRYAQAYQGLNVWPAELKVHLNESGHVDLMNGSFVPTPRRMVTHPVWSAEEALLKARAAVRGGKDARADDPELIIYAPGDRTPRLAWKIRLIAALTADWLVVIDAANGVVLTMFNQIPANRAVGEGIDLSGDTRPLDLWQAGADYYMIDTAKPMFDPASDFSSVNAINGAIIVFDMENSPLPESGKFYAAYAASLQPDDGWVPEAVSLAYHLSVTYDYYRNQHNRDSINGSGGTILGFVRVGENYDNAFWTPEYQGVFFGDAQPYAGALDVVAHEYVHGVTSHTCNLIYRDQPGALNEAFSDIFGEMVEYHVTGRTDWTNGTVLPSKRSLRDPVSNEVLNTGYQYPSKMSEFYSRSHPLLQMLVDQDYGGVHINMTIVSHCFYLLAEGLPGAVGIRDAEKIFYRAQSVHLVSNSQFIDMRLACIVSAEELFGMDSPQAAKVEEAFDAVEIFESAATPLPMPKTPVSGDDAAVFISDDPVTGASYLARYEKALDDSPPGTWLSCRDISQARPSVSGDGSTVLFVDSIQDACFIGTAPDDADSCEICLEMPGLIHSVAMSPDQDVYGFVLLEDNEPTNAITVIDLRPGGQTRTFSLVATATDSVTLNTVRFADSMCFTSDNRYLIYDAYNVLNFQDGSRIGAWSIYAIDLLHEQTLSLVGPFFDADVGYPALSRTTDHLMTFDLVDPETAQTHIVAMDLITGEADVVGTVDGEWSVPGYSGDDRAIFYTRPDSSVFTAYSYVRQALASDRLTPVGVPDLFIRDANFGVVYRRGADVIVPPEDGADEPRESGGGCFIETISMGRDRIFRR